MNPIQSYNKSRHIGAEKFAVLAKLKKIIGNDFIVVGSFSLYQHDVVQRPINDIDIIVPNDLSVDFLLTKFKGKRFTFSDYLGSTEVRERHNHCMSSYWVEGQMAFHPVAQFVIDGIKVDIFIQNNVLYEVVNYWRPDNVMERQYKVALPEVSIEAKQNYLGSLSLSDEKRLKHQKDVDSYNQIKQNKHEHN